MGIDFIIHNVYNVGRVKRVPHASKAKILRYRMFIEI